MSKLTIINDQHLFSGTSTHIYKIYKNLVKHKISTEFYQFLLSEDKPEIDSVLIKYGIFHNINGKSKFIYNFKLGLNFTTGFNWRSFKNIKSNITLLSGPSLLPLAKYNNKTMVIGHDLYFLNHYGDSVFLAKYMKRMYRHFKDASLVVVNSKFTKNEFIEKLCLDEDKIDVVYPYVDSELFHPGSSKIKSLLNFSNDDVLLLSVGGDNPNKNVETILRLMSLLPPNFKLIRVGRNFNTTKMILDLNLNDRVISLGNIDINSLAELYRGCDIFLFPSLYEGFGIPLIEAMASGIPFITSNRTSLPEVAGDSGIVCDPYDIKVMSDKIMQITMDEKIKKEIVRKGLKRANYFSAERQFESLSSVIDIMSE